MPKVEVENAYVPPWRDYKMFNRIANNGDKYITGYRISDGKQLRRYEYQKAILNDDDIPNSIEDIEKITSYKDNPKLWMKLYMRGSRRGGLGKNKGTKTNQNKRFPDSKSGKEKKRVVREKEIKTSKKVEKEKRDEDKDKREEQKIIKKVIEKVEEKDDEEKEKKKKEKIEKDEKEEDPEKLSKMKPSDLTAKQKTILKKHRAKLGQISRKETIAKKHAAAKKIQERAKTKYGKRSRMKLAKMELEERREKVEEGNKLIEKLADEKGVDINKMIAKYRVDRDTPVNEKKSFNAIIGSYPDRNAINEIDDARSILQSESKKSKIDLPKTQRTLDALRKRIRDAKKDDRLKKQLETKRFEYDDDVKLANLKKKYRASLIKGLNDARERLTPDQKRSFANQLTSKVEEDYKTFLLNKRTSKLIPKLNKILSAEKAKDDKIKEDKAKEEKKKKGLAVLAKVKELRRQRDEKAAKAAKKK